MPTSDHLTDNPPTRLHFGGEPMTRFATYVLGVDGITLQHIIEQCEETGAQFDLFANGDTIEVWLVDR